MSTPYPLQFQPEFKERVWGGRALEQFGLTPLKDILVKAG